MNKAKYNDLKERVNKYIRGDLPGQPPSHMDMGTSYLINDLLHGIVELKKTLECLGYNIEGKPEYSRLQKGFDDYIRKTFEDGNLPILKTGMTIGTYGPEGTFEETAILVKKLPDEIYDDEFISECLERWEVKIPGYPDKTFARWIDRRDVILGSKK